MSGLLILDELGLGLLLLPYRPGSLIQRVGVDTTDGQRRVDNGLQTRLSRVQAQHQSEVARILFRESSGTSGESA